jgi:hypothetical protein
VCAVRARSRRCLPQHPMRGQVVPPAIPVGTLGVPPAIPVGTTGDSSAPRHWAPADRETPRARAQHGLLARAQKTARRGRVRRGAPGTIPIPGSAVLARIHPVFAEYGETPPHGLRTQTLLFRREHSGALSARPGGLYCCRYNAPGRPGPSLISVDRLSQRRAAHVLSAASAAAAEPRCPAFSGRSSDDRLTARSAADTSAAVRCSRRQRSRQEWRE